MAVRRRNERGGDVLRAIREGRLPDHRRLKAGAAGGAVAAASSAALAAEQRLAAAARRHHRGYAAALEVERSLAALAGPAPPSW